jgi:hypothetical protein
MHITYLVDPRNGNYAFMFDGVDSSLLSQKLLIFAVKWVPISPPVDDFW